MCCDPDPVRKRLTITARGADFATSTQLVDQVVHYARSHQLAGFITPMPQHRFVIEVEADGDIVCQFIDQLATGNVTIDAERAAPLVGGAAFEIRP